MIDGSDRKHQCSAEDMSLERETGKDIAPLRKHRGMLHFLNSNGKYMYCTKAQAKKNILCKHRHVDLPHNLLFTVFWIAAFSTWKVRLEDSLSS